MSDRRQQWEVIKEQAPDVADFLLLINQAFGKPAAVRVELLESGEVIEIGGRIRVDSAALGAGQGHVCRDCMSWRRNSGAGMCTAVDRGTRRWLVDWPTQAACERFEINAGVDDV